MGEFTKIATIIFELVVESEHGESEKDFVKRIYRDVDTLELKGNERDDLTIEDAYWWPIVMNIYNLTL